MQQTLLFVLQAIQNCQLRDPERLAGFVRTIAYREVAACIGQRRRARAVEVDVESATAFPNADMNAEEAVYAQEKANIMRTALLKMSERDRQILTRFYLLGQSEQQIRTEMGLTATQFRLCKSRAKARFGEVGKRLIRMQRR